MKIRKKNQRFLFLFLCLMKVFNKHSLQEKLKDPRALIRYASGLPELHSTAYRIHSYKFQQQFGCNVLLF